MTNNTIIVLSEESLAEIQGGGWFKKLVEVGVYIADNWGDIKRGWKDGATGNYNP